MVLILGAMYVRVLFFLSTPGLWSSVGLLRTLCLGPAINTLFIIQALGRKGCSSTFAAAVWGSRQERWNPTINGNLVGSTTKILD